MEPHRCGPREVVPANAPARHWTEILVHSRLLDERAGVAADALAPAFVPRGTEPAAYEEVDHRPNRPAPVADRIKPRIVRIEAGQQMLHPARDALQVLEQAPIARVVANAGVEREEGC